MLNRTVLIISQVICGAVFLTVVWPLGGVSRLIGNPMLLRRTPAASTYKILARRSI